MPGPVIADRRRQPAPPAPAVGGNIAGHLVDAARIAPDGAALVGSDGRELWTPGSLLAAMQCSARLLGQARVRPGERVLVAVPSARGAYAGVGGVLWHGACAILPRRRADLRAVGRVQPSAVLLGGRSWLVLVTRQGRFAWTRLPPTHARRVVGKPARGTPNDAPQHVRTDATAIISFTSGTTGRPHAVLRTHGVLAAQHAALLRMRAPRRGECDLAGTPLTVLHDLAAGVTAVLPPSTRRGSSSSRLAELLRRWPVASVAGFPSLVEQVASLDPALLHPLRTVHVGGEVVSGSLIERLRRAAPNARVTVLYGATEAEPISTVDGDEYLDRIMEAPPGGGICLGRPVPEIEVVIRPLSAGQGAGVGSILVRGRHVADGGTPAGWLDTGDVGRLDGEGRLWWLGRTTVLRRDDRGQEGQS